jgi:hypothetical protein
VLPVAEYHARAYAICKAENKRFRAVERRLFGPPPYKANMGTLEEWATWHRAAARFAGVSLEKLRALPLPPKSYRTRLRRWFSLYEPLPSLLRQIAAAASAGNVERYNALFRKRVGITHQADDIEYRIRRLLPVGCPLYLPA